MGDNEKAGFLKPCLLFSLFYPKSLSLSIPLLQRRLDIVYFRPERFIHLFQFLDGLTSMQYGRMILLPDERPDFSSRKIRMVFSQIHGYLPRLHHFTFSGFRVNNCRVYAEMLAYDIGLSGRLSHL